MSDEHSVLLTVNGNRHKVRIESRKTLADTLREECNATGVHLACEHGVCGACTILLDGQAVRSCLMFAVQADGAEIVTAEGLANDDGSLGPVQEAFRQCHGLQCGFCTPGFIVTVTSMLTENPDPTDAEIREGLGGNLCRCTGYQGIIAAVKYAAPSFQDTGKGATS